MSDILEVFMRSIITIIVLFIVTKIMGKKQISQLNLYDYIIGISIGSVAADISLDTNKELIEGLLSLTIYGISAALISVVTLKSITLRRLFSSTPSMLIENGHIISEGLKKTKFDANDLLEEARNSGYADLSEIEFAIMENNGKVSFFPKDEYKPVTKKDLNLKIDKTSLCANIIIDGKIMKNNLQAINKNEKWLKQQLKVKGHQDIKNILLATFDNDEKLTVYLKGIESKLDTILE